MADDQAYIDGRLVMDSKQDMVDEIARLRAVLTKIAQDGKNCADHCRRQAAHALERCGPTGKTP